MIKPYQVFIGCPFRTAVRKNYDKLKADLEASAQEMVHLSERARSREPAITEEELDQALARANLALAESHLEQAKTAWTEKKTNATALQLNAASVFLEQATVHGTLEDDLDDAVDRAVERTEALARKLAGKAGYSADEVNTHFDDLSQVIWTMERHLESSTLSQ